MSNRSAVTLVVAACFLVIVLVVACGGGGGSQSASPTATPSETPTATATPTPSATLDGNALVTERCDSCHGSRDRISSKQWTKEQWTQEVQDMMAEQGAKLNDQEKQVVIDYLTATYGP